MNCFVFFSMLSCIICCVYLIWLHSVVLSLESIFLTGTITAQFLFCRVQNIFPTPEKISVADSRMVKLLQFARKVEGTMYEQANSRVRFLKIYVRFALLQKGLLKQIILVIIYSYGRSAWRIVSKQKESKEILKVVNYRKMGILCPLFKFEEK